MIRSLITIILLSLSINSFAQDLCQDNSKFNIGAGVYDITGPVAEQRMMGYAMLNQVSAGMYSRLWARAFVIESPCNKKRVVFINADLGMVFQAVKEEVVNKLQAKYPNVYSDDNVLITAIHTHSGPGGYSSYALYNLTILGFSKENFTTIVDGIVAAIERAQNNMQPAQIKINKGELRGVTFNRSPESYLLNPESERAKYSSNIDTEMTVLRFDSLQGKPIGMISWFPMHGVSMNNKNLLINGDNKGYSEYLFEKDFNSDYGPNAFVAAFAQTNAGDVSPNNGKEGGSGAEGIADVEKAGRPQYETAKRLYDGATEIVKGSVDFRHSFVEFDKVSIAAKYTTDGAPHNTCSAAIGVSMLAGTTDGEGLGKQGVSCNNLGNTLPGLVCEFVTTSCQGIKPIALKLGEFKPHPWVPNILPFQMFKIGNVLIAAAPFEITTMSGRRIKNTISAQLTNPNNYHVLVSSLSNAYVQYLATPEEYQLQRYEGASTVFGPWSLTALQQQYALMTEALLNNKPIAPGPKPKNLLDSQINLQPGVLFDNVPMMKKFGSVNQNVQSQYKRGDNVQVSFWGAHPKNNFRTMDTFLAVQQLINGEWKTVRTDRDWDTEYHWQRNGVSNSIVTIVWRTSQEVAPGVYRIVHFGDWKSMWDQKIRAYTGYSAQFTVF